MSLIIVNTTNVHRDETQELLTQLEENSWKHETLSKDEVNGLLELVNYVIDKRVIDKASNLSYLELINLKNKLSK